MLLLQHTHTHTPTGPVQCGKASKGGCTSGHIVAGCAPVSCQADQHAWVCCCRLTCHQHRLGGGHGWQGDLQQQQAGRVDPLATPRSQLSGVTQRQSKPRRHTRDRLSRRLLSPSESDPHTCSAQLAVQQGPAPTLKLSSCCWACCRVRVPRATEVSASTSASVRNTAVKASSRLIFLKRTNSLGRTCRVGANKGSSRRHTASHTASRVLFGQQMKFKQWRPVCGQRYTLQTWLAACCWVCPD